MVILGTATRDLPLTLTSMERDFVDEEGINAPV